MMLKIFNPIINTINHTLWAATHQLAAFTDHPCWQLISPIADMLNQLNQTMRIFLVDLHPGDGPWLSHAHVTSIQVIHPNNITSILAGENCTIPTGFNHTNQALYLLSNHASPDTISPSIGPSMNLLALFTVGLTATSLSTLIYAMICRHQYKIASHTTATLWHSNSSSSSGQSKQTPNDTLTAANTITISTLSSSAPPLNC